MLLFITAQQSPRTSEIRYMCFHTQTSSNVFILLACCTSSIKTNVIINMFIFKSLFRGTVVTKIVFLQQRTNADPYPQRSKRPYPCCSKHSWFILSGNNLSHPRCQPALVMVYRMTILYTPSTALTSTPTPHTNFQTPSCSTNADIYHPVLKLKKLSIWIRYS